MPVEPPYVELDELMELIGEAGHRLSEIEAIEGSAGNISVYIGWNIEPRHKFPIIENLELPLAIPELTGKSFLVTGSGRRLRDIIQNPAANLGFVTVDDGGKTGKLFKSPDCLFTRPTSEFNSHLAVHRDQVVRTGTNFHAVIHAHPPYLTYLSHIPRYQDENTLSRHILRWHPEIIVNLPEGLGMLPFILSGSDDLMQATVESLRIHRVVVWGKHGVMSRSDLSVLNAYDRIEYAETGARYEYLNLVNHEMGEGLSLSQIQLLCKTFGINQSIF